MFSRIEKMRDNDIKMISDNEKEWRFYMLKKIDTLEKDFVVFKIKSIMFLSTLVGSMEIIRFFV